MIKSKIINARYRKFVSRFFSISEEGFYGTESGNDADYWYKLNHPYFNVIDFEGSSIKLGVDPEFNDGEIRNRLRKNKYYHTDAGGGYFVMMPTACFLLAPDALNAAIFEKRLKRIKGYFRK